MRICKILAVAALALAAMGAAAPLAAQERALERVYRAGDQAVWLFEQDGKRIGHCWSRYDGEVDLAGTRAHAFHAQVLLQVPAAGGVLEIRYDTTLWTDAAAHPLHAQLQVLLDEAYSGVDLSYAGAQVEARIRQGPKERRQTLPAPEHGYLLANNFVSHLELALAVAAPAEGSVRLPMFSANTLAGFTLEVERVEGGPEGALYKDSLGETLRVDAAGRLQSVEIPAQKLLIRRSDEQVEPFPIAPPRAAAALDCEREEVRIEHGPVALAGTITRPKGAQGPLPAVFFISGSGGQDRDGYGGGLDLGTHELLDRLTQDGFLVLRVDDRGVGESTGPTADMGYDDLVEDARACLRFLRARPDVDPARVALIGHSEGGETAPILAAEAPAPAAIVLMAAPGRPVAELIREQLRHGMQLEGSSPEDLDKLDAAIVEFFRHVQDGSAIDPAAVPEPLRQFLPVRAWLRGHMQQDPIANIAKVRCPVLLLQGQRDIQVSPERDAAALAAALDHAGNPDHQLVVFPELDHLFKKTVGAESSGLDYLKARPLDPGFLDTLSAWLRQRLQPPAH